MYSWVEPGLFCSSRDIKTKRFFSNIQIFTMVLRRGKHNIYQKRTVLLVSIFYISREMTKTQIKNIQREKKKDKHR